MRQLHPANFREWPSPGCDRPCLPTAGRHLGGCGLSKGWAPWAAPATQGDFKMRKYLVAFGAVLLLATPAIAQDATLVFTALDTNKDGKISQDEAQRNTAVSQAFAAADKNHDGFLSKDEFMAAFGKK